MTRRLRGLLLGPLLVCLGCSSSVERQASITWQLDEGFCERLPLPQLTAAAGWGALAPTDVDELMTDLGQGHAASCTLDGDGDYAGTDAPLDHGQLFVTIDVAAETSQVTSIRESFLGRGRFDETFAVRGPYDKAEAPITGWWSEGSSTTYTQDLGGESLPATRVITSAKVIDDNLTATVTVLAQVLADGPERVERLETLTVDTLLALEDAVVRTDSG